MKISYRKDSGTSCMVIGDVHPDTVDSFFMKMMAANRVPRLLNLKTEKINGQTLFLYDITGKCSLEKTFETRKMSMDIFVSFMDSLKILSDDLSELLIDADRILLRTDAVFLDHSCSEFWFCAYPWPGPGSRSDIRVFFDRLLSLIDYDDHRLVALVFSLSRMTQNGSFTLQDLLSVNVSTVSGAGSAVSTVSVSSSVENTAARKQERPTASFIEKARIYFRGKSVSDIYDAVNSGKLFRLIKETPVPYASLPEKIADPHPSFMEEPRYAEKPDPVSDTASLDISDFPFHRLNGLDTASGIVILLDHFPFTIGKEETCTDYRLDRPAISRAHCRIHENEDGSFDIEDLNSTNGSSVNENGLSPYFRHPLIPGDIVTLADMKFMFM